jgi:glutamate transport system permease protein
VLAEIFRAGVASLPRGQSEAAYALGMRKTQVMSFVLLPQAIRVMLPTIVSQLVVLLKDTALGFLIGFQELLFVARTLGSQGQFNFPIIPVAIVVAILYIAMCLLLSALAKYLEQRTRRSPKRADIDPAGKADNEVTISQATD